MAQSPAYIQTKVLDIGNPSVNTFINLSTTDYGVPGRISFLGVAGTCSSSSNTSIYQEFYNGNSGDPFLVLDIIPETFFSFGNYSTFMDEDSSIRISNGLYVYFRAATDNIAYSSMTLFYK